VNSKTKLNNWQQIEDLFHDALQLTAPDRDVFLARMCASDESLRREVETLILAFESEQGFMEQPAFSSGLKILSDRVGGELEGSTIGQYRIEMLLGQGGMGEVYLAEDCELNRKVALKFLKTTLTDDELAKRQLRKEARASARLEHPNICTVYGLQEIDGYNFIVMQYVEGQTLSALMQSEPLKLANFINLAEQIVDALSAAHEYGIIHRDIKPQNIVVTADGQAKVLDFGLAKIVQQVKDADGQAQSQFSQSKLIVGTVAYMSPEQLRAEELDFRSDIFSAGVLLYEMINGKNPHVQASEAETISAILTSPLPRPTGHVNRTRHNLNRIIYKCLEKNKERRYQSVGELLADLRRLRQRSYKLFYPEPRTVAALALIVLLIGGLLYVYLGFRRTQTLAIIPLINESGAPVPEYLDTGFTESLGNKLSSLSRLRVKAPTMLPSGQGRQSSDLQNVGRELQADAVLITKLQQHGEELIVQLNLVNTANGVTLWTEEYDIAKIKLLSLQEEVTKKVVSALHLMVNGDDKSLLAKHSTEDAEAFKLYLHGRYFWDRRDKDDNLDKAITYFRKATDRDPSFAQAWAGLAQSYVLRPTVAYGAEPTLEAMDKAKYAANKAIEADATVGEAHVALGIVNTRYHHRWTEAEKEFKQAIELNPNDPAAHFWYSILLAATGRFKEAIAQSEAARTSDPFSPTVYMNLGRAYYYDHQYDKAIEYLTKVLNEEPNYTGASYSLGFVYLQQGRYSEAIDIFQKINILKGAAPLGYAYAKTGRKLEARQLLDKLDELEKNHNEVPPQERAIIYIGLDDKDQAFFWLNKAYEEHFPSLIFLVSEPLFFDNLSSDQRFTELARKLNLVQ
jgi:serine/threonine protein kinase/Flp pilus assembly protein TadD